MGNFMQRDVIEDVLNLLRRRRDEIFRVKDERTGRGKSLSAVAIIPRIERRTETRFRAVRIAEPEIEKDIVDRNQFAVDGIRIVDIFRAYRNHLFPTRDRFFPQFKIDGIRNVAVGHGRTLNARLAEHANGAGRLKLVREFVRVFRAVRAAFGCERRIRAYRPHGT